MSSSESVAGKLIDLGHEEAARLIADAEGRARGLKIDSEAILHDAREEASKILVAAHEAGNKIFDERVCGADALLKRDAMKEKRVMTVYLTECGLAAFIAISGGGLAAFGQHQLSNYVVSGLFTTVATTLLLHSHFRGPQSQGYKEAPISRKRILSPRV
jgi:hypothetical protein